MRQVSEVVSDFRKKKKNGELEIRIGKYINGKFIPGVERHEFDQLITDMQSAPTLEGEETWSEVLDYHYNTRDVKTRTRVTFDSENMNVKTEHITKVTENECVLEHSSEDENAFRVSFASETPVNDPPNVCIPSYVRIKQRRRFKDVREGNLVWCYELSKTWSANSRSAVEHAQHMVAPVYEVECELVDENGSYMSANTDVKIARSILMKSQLLLGEEQDDVTFNPVQRERPDSKRRRSSNSKPSR
ncbi:MAG: hypothetical protein CBC12_00580 [Candidatus Puniceispirillum sp. TMED52]|nr:MAG: hypothetical protein CBC12_00580 [Candidatus Puniceispirillum sp. TMED52]